MSSVFVFDGLSTVNIGTVNIFKRNKIFAFSLTFDNVHEPRHKPNKNNYYRM